jgi:predicted glycosyltransferase involved in capsule biosynthesis
MKRPLMNLIPDKMWNKHCKINYIPMPAYKEPKGFYKISIVTTCMDRTCDLEQTYLKNIEDNKDYPNLEWVLLSYNSRDRFDTWTLKLPECVKVYKTEEPRFYSMAHSRNIGFRLATGDIVSSVDADHFISKGCLQINELANSLGLRHIFVKSEQKNRGRITMFKKDFLKLGGYDEDLKDYGHEDRDLLFRACACGFKVVKYGGDFFTLAADHSRHPVSNYQNKDWRYTQDRNALISFYNLFNKRFKANKNKDWGKAKLVTDFFDEELDGCECQAAR